MSHLRQFAGILILTVLVSYSTAAVGQTPPGDSVGNGEKHTVQEVQRLYDGGKIEDAEFLALKLLNSDMELSPQERWNLHIYIALCAMANDNQNYAVTQFTEALRLNPAMNEDPVNWSPKVRAAFAIARDQFKRVIEADRLSRIALSAEYCRHASLRSLYLPGSGQVMKGQTYRGLTTGILFWGGMALFIYTELEIPRARDSYRNATNISDINSHYDHYRSYYRAGIASGLFTLGVYTYTFFDALWAEPEPQSLPSQENVPPGK